jgi:cardiolipin synthase
LDVENDIKQTMNSARNLPNALSLARLFLVPAAVWLILSEQWGWAFVVFAVAGISDALDGLLARLLKAQTLLGAWLDPLADKALIVCVYLSLVAKGMLPLWLVVLVALRDVVIVLYAVVDIAKGRLPMRPLLISKLNTAAQILLALDILAQLGIGWSNAMLTEAMVLVVAVTTTASGAAYLISAEGKQQ